MLFYIYTSYHISPLNYRGSSQSFGRTKPLINVAANQPLVVSLFLFFLLFENNFFIFSFRFYKWSRPVLPRSLIGFRYTAFPIIESYRGPVIVTLEAQL